MGEEKEKETGIEKEQEEKKEQEFIADLHIHSRFSRACSKNITIPELVKWAKVKGIGLLGTSDFTHPEWLGEIKKFLVEKDGLYWKGDFPFMLTGEVSLMYTHGRGRRVHILLLVPSLEVVDKINAYLDTKGRRDYDGRPIFKIPCEEFVREMRKISDKIEIIPAHCLIGEEVIHTNYSLKKIKDIREGDLVYTHKNKWKKVTKIFKRHYSGKIYKIRPWYFTEGLKTTLEHPFYAIKAYKCSWIKGLCKNGCSKLSECKNKRFEKYIREWVPSSELKEGDFLIYPRFKVILDKKNFHGIKITPEFCRLLGYYLAEGYTIGEEAIGFSFSKDENNYIEEVIYLINKYFNKEKFKIDERKGKDIIFYSKNLNNFFKNFYNSNVKRACSKSLPQFMLNLPLNKQVEIFRGWYRGDKGYTVSRESMNQMKIICLRLGIIPNIYLDEVEKYEKRGKHFINGRKIKANNNLYSFHNLSFFEDKFNLLTEDIFSKFKTKMYRRHGWFDNEYIYIPIRKIEIHDYTGEVYNLEVEGDNSYVSEFACVHNCWTPWFGVFGSSTGYNSLKEAFGSEFENIHAIETGMSSDPEMNWRISELNGKSIVSFSDAHSFWPWRLGREATIFIGKRGYENILRQIRENSFKATIETDPAYGKYHFDGHRVCGFSCSPQKSKELGNICPVCKKPLIIGVENRVEQLSTNPFGFMPKNAKPFYKLLPLHELIALAKKSTLSSKKTWEIYNHLIEKFGNEFNILLHVDKMDLARELKDEELIVQLIIDNRIGNIKVKAGFDGIYGQAMLKEKQGKLF